MKVGGGMAPNSESHHHHASTKNAHKPFKSRHATKNLIRELAKGKTESGANRSRKTPFQQVLSKFDRKNQARQLRDVKHQQNVKSTSIFAGPNGAPRVVAVVPLSRDLDAKIAIESLNDGVDAEAQWDELLHSRVRVDRFKQNLVYLPVRRNLTEALDACRLADFVIFLLSPTEEPGKEGDLLLKTIEGQGISNVLTMVQNLNTIEPPKRRPQVLSSLKSYITHYFPTQDKVLSLDSVSECANAVRSLCMTTPKGINWRENRSWMLVEDIKWLSQKQPPADQGQVMLTGVVRGKGLKANRLVQVGDWGHFQIDRIESAALPTSRKRKANDMTIDIDPIQTHVLDAPNEEQEDLSQLAPYEAVMEDADAASSFKVQTARRGVLLDDHHYFSDDETHLPEAPRRLPKGTSQYQAAWFLGDMSEADSDSEDEEDEQGDLNFDSPSFPQEDLESAEQAMQRAPTEAAPSEYLHSEMFLDPSPDEEAAQLAEYRTKRKKEAEEDLEFPDEIELHPNVLARERLARYRGLKSIKTSRWETSEDKAHEPEEWDRLLPIPDYKRAKKQFYNEALVGGIRPGTRVHVHLRDVPSSLQQQYTPPQPLALCSLLRHEQKRTVVNFSITLSSEHPKPLRSKEELILQCGPRRFTINPLYSQSGNTPNDVHKFQRYLHPGQTAIASFIAPVTWGSVPALFFQPAAATSPDTSLRLVATGTSLPASTSRIIAKRVILTGHPYKIHKKLVTVRYMFFNKDDVKWFKALQLRTKRGRSGFIKESLGTHGYFKATFDATINPQDAVSVSLYKRCFPKEARAWRPYESREVDEEINEGPELMHAT